jgi:hypothetical protein
MTPRRTDSWLNVVDHHNLDSCPATKSDPSIVTNEGEGVDPVVARHARPGRAERRALFRRRTTIDQGVGE